MGATEKRQSRVGRIERGDTALGLLLNVVVRFIEQSVFR